MMRWEYLIQHLDPQSDINLEEQWLDAHGAGYLAWSWNALPACIPGRTAESAPWPLVSSYGSGAPVGGYAQTFRDHVAGLLAGN